MQTFLPYPDFKKSAECLDRARLGKQRVEARQIIDLLEKHDAGIDISKLPWGNHPAVRMWIGYTDSLKVYYNIVCEEWIHRGYNHNMGFYTPHLINDKCGGNKYKLPDWFGRKDFHDAHKSNLLRKDYEYYKQFGWDVPLDLKYMWE